jgi:hypothetical protein
MIEVYGSKGHQEEISTLCGNLNMLEHVDIKFNAVSEGTLQWEEHFLKWNTRHITVWCAGHYILQNGRP